METKHVTRLNRCFIAIQPDLAVQTKLKWMIKALTQRIHTKAIHWTPIPNLHLTISFIGKITPTQLQQLHHTLQQALTEFPQFTLQLTEPRLFPSPEHSRVIALMARVSPLIHLHKLVQQQLSTLNLPVEQRPFCGHMSIARIKGHYQLSDEQLKMSEETSMQVNKVMIFNSETLPDGAIYHCLATIPLVNQ